MMVMRKLKSLLAIAEVKRSDSVSNSDEWVVRKLREDKSERLDLLHKIKGDPMVKDQAADLANEIASIDHALTAYPEIGSV